jgi:hypothetical protein
MAIKGRKQLAVHITDEHHEIFNQIKEETGLSNAKIVEMLIQNYANTKNRAVETTSTTIKPKSVEVITHVAQNFVTEERVKELIQEALSSLPQKEEVEEKPKKKLITMTPEEIEASCTYEDVSPPIPEWDEQKWLDEDFMEFSNDPNPPEIIRTKKVEEIKPSITDEDDDW